MRRSFLLLGALCIACAPAARPESPPPAGTSEEPKPAMASTGNPTDDVEIPPPPPDVDEMPPPTPPKSKPTTAPCAGLDKGAVLQTLKAIQYKDCGSGGGGKVAVRFDPKGHVRKAEIAAGTYTPTVKKCLESRFMHAKVPPFCGDVTTVAWSISL